jgi:hypothetical protein
MNSALGNIPNTGVWRGKNAFWFNVWVIDFMFGWFHVCLGDWFHVWVIDFLVVRLTSCLGYLFLVWMIDLMFGWLISSLGDWFHVWVIDFLLGDWFHVWVIDFLFIIKPFKSSPVLGYCDFWTRCCLADRELLNGR